MPKYAIYDDSIVHNVILAESEEVAKNLTGMNAIYTDGEPWIGWSVNGEIFTAPQPYPSWILEDNKWVAPIPKPDDEYWQWNENIKNWEKPA